MRRIDELAVLGMTLMLVTVAVDAGAEREIASTRMVAYRGVPVTIDLPLNQEIRVHFDESVEVGLPVALSAQLDVSSVHGIVYLTALQPFTSQRLALKGTQSGRFMLLDVVASPDSDTSRDIVIRTDGATLVPDVQPSLTIAQLMRYIAQTTLAPRRPEPLPSRIKRTVLALPADRIYRDFVVVSQLLAAWRTDSWLAIAIELRNQSDEAIALSPGDIAGSWIAVGFQHTRLLPRGKRGAQTVMFLVGSHDAIAELQY